MRYRDGEDRETALAREIRRRLKDDERLQIANLGVRVDDHQVELMGEVPNLFQRDLASQIASTVSGVSGVNNRLVVPRLGRSDREIARAVQAALAANHMVNESSVTVRVLDAVVVLEGILSSHEERDEAETIARLTPGAQGVINRIDLALPQDLPDTEVAGNVQAALLQELLLGPSEIQVEVEGGVAFLRGSVMNLSLRQRVEAVVARAPGVKRVVNELSVKER